MQGYRTFVNQGGIIDQDDIYFSVEVLQALKMNCLVELQIDIMQEKAVYPVDNIFGQFQIFQEVPDYWQKTYQV